MTPASDVVAGAYAAHQRAVYAYAVRAVRDADLAQDITQESFLRLMSEARRSRMPENVRAWLIHVAANLVVDGGRRRAIATRWAGMLAGAPESAESPESLVLLREQRAHVARVLVMVPRPARTGLVMAAHGFTGREIATALGRSEPATRTLLSRARRRLRVTIEGGRAGGGDSGARMGPGTGEPMDASHQGCRTGVPAAGLSGGSA